jgi:hypothetical protein
MKERRRVTKSQAAREGNGWVNGCSPVKYLDRIYFLCGEGVAHIHTHTSRGGEVLLQSDDEEGGTKYECNKQKININIISARSR